VFLGAAICSKQRVFRRFVGKRNKTAILTFFLARASAQKNILTWA
jgi:hypothetical protein